MPRQARLDVPGTLQHVTALGIERGHIFRDDQDRQNFLSRLAPLFFETQTSCYAWALLPDHFHILIKTGRVPLSQIMRRLMTGYAVSFNKRHRRNGHLFQNRYKSIICQEEPYLMELIRYIHLNPLRVGLVQDLSGLDRYPWCGHSVLLGHHPDPFLNKGGNDLVLLLFEKDVRPARQAYRYFVAQGVKQGHRPEFQGGGVTRCNAKGNGNETKPGRLDERILGEGKFVENILKEKAKKKTQSKIQMVLEDLIELVTGWLALDKEDLLSGRRKKEVGSGRALISYIGSHELGYRFTELGQALNIHPVSAARNSDKGKKLFNQYKNRWRKSSCSGGPRPKQNPGL